MDTTAIGCIVCGGVTVVPRQTKVMTLEMEGWCITTTLYANFLKKILSTFNVSLLCEQCGTEVFRQYELR